MRGKTFLVLGLMTVVLGMQTIVWADGPIALSGKILDKKKVLLQGIMDEGARWSGKLDAIGQRVINIRAYASDGTIASVNPDLSGSYRLQAPAPVEKIVLEVDAGTLYYQVEGPWSSDANVPLDLDKGGLFIVEGHVKESGGGPAAFRAIRALDAEGATMSHGITRSKGNFKFLSNRPIDALSVDISYSSPTVMTGPWSSDAKVVITPSA